jgi:DedD protein
MGKDERKVHEGIVKNLDQIQEDDQPGRPSRVSALIMASFGGACIVFAALALMRSPTEPDAAPTDPLGDLVAASKPDTKEAKSNSIDVDDVTFPAVLTDQARPTTAMEAVRRRNTKTTPDGDADVLPRAAVEFEGPPPAGDRLPVIPLPAQDMLAGTPEANVAKADTLRNLARHVGRENHSAEMAEPGRAGGYQLQVSSFKERGEADAFATILRRRGHRAYVQSAHVKGRGLWHRVRIGPFKYRRSADTYRQDFEAKERVVGFVVKPPKTKIRIAPASGD